MRHRWSHGRRVSASHHANVLSAQVMTTKPGSKLSCANHGEGRSQFSYARATQRSSRASIAASTLAGLLACCGCSRGPAGLLRVQSRTCWPVAGVRACASGARVRRRVPYEALRHREGCRTRVREQWAVRVLAGRCKVRTRLTPQRTSPSHGGSAWTGEQRGASRASQTGAEQPMEALLRTLRVLEVL